MGGLRPAGGAVHAPGWVPPSRGWGGGIFLLTPARVYAMLPVTRDCLAECAGTVPFFLPCAPWGRD